MRNHRVFLVATLSALALTGGVSSAQQLEGTYTLQSNPVVLARVKESNKFLAYSKRGGKWNSHTFPDGVLATPVLSNDGVCVFDLEGEAITEVVAVDRDGNWCSSRLPAAVKKCSPSVACGMAVVSVEGGAHAFNAKRGTWTSYTFPDGVLAGPVFLREFGDGAGCVFHLEGVAITEVVAVDQDGNWRSSRLPAAVKKCSPLVGAGVAVVFVDGKAHAFSAELGKWDSVAATVEPKVSKDMVMIIAPDSISVFSSATGRWAVAQTTK